MSGVAYKVRFYGVDPLNIGAGATQPILRDSWRFAFTSEQDGTLRFAFNDSGPLVLTAATDAVEAERDAWKETVHDEIAANLAFREAGGAMPDEDMPTFCARLIAERDALRAEVAHWKANHDNQVSRARLLTERTDMPVERIAAYEEMGRLRTERDALRAFAQAVMEAWPEDGIDGDDLQAIAITRGMLRPEQRTERCGDKCMCAGYAEAEDWPITCYRRTALLTGAKTTTPEHTQ